MGQVRLAHEGDRGEWNNLIKKSGGMIYWTWEWCRMIERGFGDKAVKLLFVENGKMLGIMPVFIIKRPGKLIQGNIAWSPHPGVWGYGGPLVSPEANDKKITEEICIKFIDFVKNRLSSEHKLVDLRISCLKDEMSGIIRKILEEKFKNRWTKVDRYSGYLDLRKEPEVLLKDMKKEHRKAIRQAEKHGVEIKEAKSSKDIDLFYDEFESEITHRKGFALNPRDYYHAFWDIVVDKGNGKVYYAELKGKKIGFQLVTCYNGIVCAEHNASPRSMLKYRQNNLFKWHIIREFHEKGYRLLDLGGIPKDDDSGVYRFKMGWCPEKFEAPWYRLAIKHPWRVYKRKIKKTFKRER